MVLALIDMPQKHGMGVKVNGHWTTLPECYVHRLILVTYEMTDSSERSELRRLQLYSASRNTCFHSSQLEAT